MHEDTDIWPSRDAVPERYKWDLSQIFPDDAAWRAACADMAVKVDRYAALRGTLGSGGAALLAAYRLDDALGQLAYKVWYFVSLHHDEDQRDNTRAARRQEVQTLFVRWRQAAAWFGPELLAIPLDTVRGWLDQDPDLAVYRFAVEELYRQQEHVLDEKGEHLLSLAGRLASAPDEAYAALSTADARFPTITLRRGEDVHVTRGRYRALVATERDPEDRAAAYRALHEVFAQNANTYAAIYGGVMQRDWFYAQARGYDSTLAAALHGNDIPTSVVENLIAATRAGVAPLQRYHRLRKRALGLEHYGPQDTAIPTVQLDRRYPYDGALGALEAAIAPLGEAYGRQFRTALRGRYVDVYETPGKASGAYSAPVYGVHPYMLMNYTNTLESVFTLAHEMGHTLHTLLAHARQPFVYAGYTIFVAEVPSTLNEALLLRHMLRESTDPRERAVLLHHAIDEIVGTFYAQVLFAEFELRAHQMVEQGRPITADVLGDLYLELQKAWHGDSIEYGPLARTSWSRVPHFFGSPYYVYQYATCYASSAQLVAEITQEDPGKRAEALERFMALLEAGGSDHPMTLLRNAGVDLAKPDPVQAVVAQLDGLVTELEAALGELGVI